MLANIPKMNFNISVTFIVSSANAFNLDQSTIMSFGKEIKHYFNPNPNNHLL